MKSSYKLIGNYVKQSSLRNIDNIADEPQGVNINKEFMPSVANTLGTDLSKYRVVEKYQFAFNPMHVGRDEVLPIAMLLKDEPIIVSPAYVVFKIKDHEDLLPEYLMMWMRRSEFDREAWFTTDSSVRGGFSWSDFCAMQLPVPHIDKQREIVKEYNTIVDHISLNEKLNRKLEETAQAIYKHWFVDFEFPVSKEYAADIGMPKLEGMPYKSSSGEMVWNGNLEKEIPVGWEDGTFESFSELIDGDRGKNYPSQGDFFEEGHCLFLNTGNVTKSGFDFSSTSFITEEKDNALRKGKLKRYDSVLTTRGTVGNCAYFSEEVEYNHLRINSGMIIIRPLDVAKYKVFNYQLLKSPIMKNAIFSFLSGSAQQQLPIKDIRRISILKPVDSYIEKSMKLIEPLQKNIDSNNKNNRKSKELLSLLLSKMTKAEATT